MRHSDDRRKDPSLPSRQRPSSRGCWRSANAAWWSLHVCVAENVLRNSPIKPLYTLNSHLRDLAVDVGRRRHASDGMKRSYHAHVITAGKRASCWRRTWPRTAVMYSDGAFPSSTHLRRTAATSSPKKRHGINRALSWSGDGIDGADGRKPHLMRSLDTVASVAPPALCRSPSSFTMLFLQAGRVETV